MVQNAWLEAPGDEEARQRLASIYHRFTEAFGFADLVSTKTLLDALGGSWRAGPEAPHKRRPGPPLGTGGASPASPVIWENGAGS